MARETEERWAERVAAWRASGLSSEEFSRGREFTAGGLRHWAYRLGQSGRGGAGAGGSKKARSGTSAPRLARVTLRRAAASVPASTADGMGSLAEPRTATGVTLDVGRVRITLAPGFDRETLVAVIAALGAGTEGTR